MDRTLEFPRGSIVAIDRGYNDYAWYHQLTERGIFFVTRLKSNGKSRVIHRLPVLADKGLTSDHTIEFTGIQTAPKCPIQLRRIGYRDPGTGRHDVFLTNNFKLAAKTIADIYQARWQLGLFLIWIKQSLKIETIRWLCSESQRDNSEYRYEETITILWVSFSGEIVSHRVWLYHQFTLRCRNIEDLLAEGAIVVAYESFLLSCI